MDDETAADSCLVFRNSLIILVKLNLIMSECSDILVFVTQCSWSVLQVSRFMQLDLIQVEQIDSDCFILTLTYIETKTDSN